MSDQNPASGLVFEPHDKVAVITGAAGGIGLGMARAFTAAGMSVVLADIDADRIEATAAGLRAAGHDATGVATDVSKFDDIQALADAAIDTHGRVDVLCNNAGAAIFAKLFNVTVEDWEWTLGVDLWGPIYGTKVFQPIIQDTATQGGHINTTSSVAGLIAGAAAGPYNVAKSGVIALMATLEREFRIAKSPHHASVLCPGPINTDINRNSARNRRDAAQQTHSEPGDSGAAGKKLGSKMADFLAKGMDPDEVGRIVLDGIVTGKFWMFTHPKILAIYREQIEMMDPDGLLSIGKFA